MNISFKEILSRLNIPGEVYERYNEPHRFYHTTDHLNDLLQQIVKRNLQHEDALLWAVVYHDAIYDPKSATNEEDSAALFNCHFNGSTGLRAEITSIINETKTHQPTTALSAVFSEMDLNILRQPLDRLLEYEHQIFKEFQFADFLAYQAGRLKVLQQLSQQVDNPALVHLMDYVRVRQPRIAVYPGSFDPFQQEHHDVLQKAEQIFDKVIIARDMNAVKPGEMFDLPIILRFRQIETYKGLLSHFIEGLGYPVTVIGD